MGIVACQRDIVPVGICDSIGAGKGSAYRCCQQYLSFFRYGNCGIAVRTTNPQHLALATLYASRYREGMSGTLWPEAYHLACRKRHTLGGIAFGHSLSFLEGVEK